MIFYRRAPSTLFIASLMVMAAGLSPSLGAATTSKGKASEPAPAPKPTGCAPRQFRTLALTTHDPKERENTALAWLKSNGAACTLAQISYLSANSAQWLGTADTVRVNGLFDELVDAKSGEFVGDKAPKPPARVEADASAKGRPQGPNGPTTVVPPPAAAPTPAVVMTPPPGAGNPDATSAAGTPATPGAGK